MVDGQNCAVRVDDGNVRRQGIQRSTRKTLRLRQGEFSLLLPGDIDVRAEHALGLPIFIIEQGCLRQDPAIAAVLVTHAKFLLVVGPRACSIAHCSLARVREVVGMDQPLPFGEFVADLVVLVAKLSLPFEGIVDAVAAQIPIPQSNVRRPHSQPQPSLGCPFGVLGALAVSDVECYDENAVDRSAGFA